MEAISQGKLITLANWSWNYLSNLKKFCKAIKDCNSFKAPNPDGFNFAFVKKAWGIIKSDVLTFLQDFYQNSKLTKGINASFVALIPKVEGSSNFKEFRPISMGVALQIVTKSFGKQVQKGASKVLVGETQAAFMEGRQILDGILRPNKVIDEWK